MTESTKSSSPTVGDLREQLRHAEVDAAYWRGRAESLDALMAHRSQPTAGANLPPELLAGLLAAKMKEKKDAQESA